jgi:4-hydroxybenzoate polyprenyltransferase
MSVRAYRDLARPFTLMPPVLGFLSGAVTAWGAGHQRPPLTGELLTPVLLGALMAAVLNAASNAINQIYDLAIDRVNKPKRPLPSGALTIGQAWGFTAVAYVLAWVLAWLVSPGGRHECFWIVLVASVLTWMYSAPALPHQAPRDLGQHHDRHPRGVLLKVAGWSSVKTILGVEPWYIGAIFGLFLLGASTTKDFADIEGDRADGCTTLPILYGVRRAAWIISPFFVLPFVLIPVGALTGILTGNRTLLLILGPVLIAYGIYTSYLMVRKPESWPPPRTTSRGSTCT